MTLATGVNDSHLKAGQLMSIPKETSAPVTKSASAKKMLMGDLMQTVGILPILILIVAVFGFIAPNFFTESNLLNITRQASINIVLAAGMTSSSSPAALTFPSAPFSAPPRWRQWWCR